MLVKLRYWNLLRLELTVNTGAKFLGAIKLLFHIPEYRETLKEFFRVTLSAHIAFGRVECQFL